MKNYYKIVTNALATALVAGSIGCRTTLPTRINTSNPTPVIEWVPASDQKERAEDPFQIPVREAVKMIDSVREFFPKRYPCSRFDNNESYYGTTLGDFMSHGFQFDYGFPSDNFLKGEAKIGFYEPFFKEDGKTDLNKSKLVGIVFDSSGKIKQVYSRPLDSEDPMVILPLDPDSTYYPFDNSSNSTTTNSYNRKEKMSKDRAEQIVSYVRDNFRKRMCK